MDPHDETRSDEAPEQALRRVLDNDPRSLAPMAAMADALRANAEALRRIDQSQRRMAERMERTDRAQQVVTSTRALNETFRGLSEIQRGLLDAVVKARGRGARPGFLAALLAVGLLTGLLGFLLADRWLERDKVSRTLFEQTQSRVDALADEKADLAARLHAAETASTGLERRLEERGEASRAAGRERDELADRVKELEKELETKQARLEEYVAVKAQAETAGRYQIDNMALRRENERLRGKVAKLEGAERKLLAFFGEKLAESGGIDPDVMMRAAKQMGIVKEAPPPAEPGGPVRLEGRRKRLFLDQGNRLLPDADEAYDLFEVGSIEEGCVLRDVTLARHLAGRLVSTIKAKELRITADPERDTVEFELEDGYITTTRHNGEKIPIGEDGHYIYLSRVGLKDWLRRARYFAVAEDGRLTWKRSTP